MNISFTKITVLMLLLAAMAGCTREKINQYEIEDVTLYTSASDKKNLKTDEQFISILYTDIYGKSISNSEMKGLARAYTSMGDKNIVIDLMIKSLLADENAGIPAKEEMTANPESFAEETYKRFLVRKPTKQEVWFLTNQIVKNPDLEPIDIYYALLTSEEYRYY